MEAQKMTLAEARQILGNRPRWELLQIKRALSMLELLNTPEEAQRLEAARLLLGAMPKPWA
jgi:hypothetical protein